MSTYGNFNVKPFEDLKEQASKVFGDLVENITVIKTECATMSDIVMSDDSKLGTRWRDISDKMDQPIQSMEDTILVVKSLLDAYITNTLANEEQATKELEEIDNNITVLTTRAETLLSGLTSLRGIGFGASAIVIPGLVGWDPATPVSTTTPGTGTPEATVSITEPTTKYAPPTSISTESTTKYAPPSCIEATTKYAPPTAEGTLTTIEPTTKYAPPSDFEVVTKYAPPSGLATEVTTKYAPPTGELYTEVTPTYTEVTTKYAPPSGLYTEVTPTTKYAPPTYTEVTPTTKYAPPSGLYTEVTTKYAPPSGFSVASSGKIESVKPTSGAYKLSMDSDSSVIGSFGLKETQSKQGITADGTIVFTNNEAKLK